MLKKIVWLKKSKKTCDFHLHANKGRRTQKAAAVITVILFNHEQCVFTVHGAVCLFSVSYCFSHEAKPASDCTQVTVAAFPYSGSLTVCLFTLLISLLPCTSVYMRFDLPLLLFFSGPFSYFLVRYKLWFVVIF